MWQELVIIHNPLIAELILKYRCVRFQKIAYFIGVYKTVARLSMFVPLSRTIFNTSYQRIKKAYSEKKALDTSVHELALEQVYKYMLVGGMPEVVDTYITTQNLFEAREILKVLYDNYLADMEL